MEWLMEKELCSTLTDLVFKEISKMIRNMVSGYSMIKRHKPRDKGSTFQMKESLG